MKKIVHSKADYRANLKAIATLVGAIATALATLYAPDTTIGGFLPTIAIIATVITTWAVPNATVAKIGDNPSGQEYDDGFDPNDRGEDESYQDYDDEVAAAQAYQPQHRADEEPVTWADEAPQVEGDVEDDGYPVEADTPLPAFDMDSPRQRLS